ncbi:MAG: methyltransferase domain-containing protein [Lentisphaeria bacterium]|nr:methyltransferase domain-containing protein [Lentisphaeria bacterium]NQZ70678.1 methyltransferase domain-containing protein [Lentisphaeria bacterium]
MIIDKTVMAKNFGKQAEGYEDATPVQSEMANELIELCIKNLSCPPLNILELGCGTGRVTEKLTKLYPDAQITALDISKEMVQQAESMASEKCRFITCDAEKFIRATSKSYDLIISNACFQWFETPIESFEIARQKLNPGGHILLSTFSAQTFTELKESFDYAYRNHATKNLHHVDLLAVDAWQLLAHISITEKTKKTRHDTVTSFLHSIKQAGASSPAKARLTKKVLDDMIHYYNSHFSFENEIIASYHYLLIHGRNNE